MLLFDKKLQSQSKHLPDMLHTLLSTPSAHDAIAEVAELYAKRCASVYTINLVRWYGLFRNDGAYNKDAYFALVNKVMEIRDQLEALRAESHEYCPAEKALSKLRQSIQQGSVRQAGASQIEDSLSFLFSCVVSVKRKSGEGSERVTSLSEMVKLLPRARRRIILPKIMDNEYLDLSEEVVKKDYTNHRIPYQKLSQLGPPEQGLGLAFEKADLTFYHLACLAVA